MSMFFIDPYRFGVQPDPYWGSVSVLIHCDGTVGSSSFPDSGPIGYATAVGSVNARISDAQTMPGFGNSGVFTAASTSYLQVSNTTPNMSFAASAWTVECFFFEVTGSQHALVGKQSGAGLESAIFTDHFQCPLNGIPVVTALSWSAPSLNTWHHFALSRNGASLYAFIDGVLVASRSDVSGIGYSGTYTNIGQSSQSRTQPFAGHIDEFRWTRACRYTADFTPPTAPFPNF